MRTSRKIERFTQMRQYAQLAQTRMFYASAQLRMFKHNTSENTLRELRDYANMRNNNAQLCMGCFARLRMLKHNTSETRCACCAIAQIYATDVKGEVLRNCGCPYMPPTVCLFVDGLVLIGINYNGFDFALFKII